MVPPLSMSAYLYENQTTSRRGDSMKIQSKMSVIPVAIMLCLLIGLPVQAKEASELRGDSSRKSEGSYSDERERDLYQLSASEFFDLDKVKEKIDIENVNHTLLSLALFHETNLQRKEHDREPLRHLPKLDEAAQIHAENMAEHELLAHINPKEGEPRAPEDRVREVGLEIQYVAENVATHFGVDYEEGRGVRPVERDGDEKFVYRGGEKVDTHTYRTFAQNLLEQWMGSQGHRENILSQRPEFLGTGCSINREEETMDKFYCVQVFYDHFGT
jgi:uncharacterized protein YkwD